jgi:hypothetical protein
MASNDNLQGHGDESLESMTANFCTTDVTVNSPRGNLYVTKETIYEKGW